MLFFVLLAAAAAVIVAALSGLIVYHHVTQPGVAGENVAVTIPEGATGHDAGRLLAEKGLVEHELFFRLAMKLDRTRRPIRYGYYNLPGGLSPSQLLELLQEGPNRAPSAAELPPELRPTIPEGLSLAQMARNFSEPEAFLEAASDPALIARLGIRAPTLEGFLMPETYFFDQKPTARELVERMAAEFEKVYAELAALYTPPAGFDKLAIVTIASLIEEEARVPEERPKIGAVIYNRLKRNMPLQLDSTLQYALNKYGQQLLYEDREVDSPYNTYKNVGLPPGPISNPGKASIQAALAPERSDSLYFVSNADGLTHTFSASLTEHTRAVNNFRREIAPQRKELQEKADMVSTE